MITDSLRLPVIKIGRCQRVRGRFGFMAKMGILPTNGADFEATEGLNDAIQVEA